MISDLEKYLHATDLTVDHNVQLLVLSQVEVEAMIEWGDFSPLEPSLESTLQSVTSGKTETSWLILKITKE